MSAEAVELRGKKFDWPELLSEALEAEGTIGTQYSAFHSYSYMNRLLLFMQGAREPTASYKRWQALNRQVMKGSQGLVIVRPIIIKREQPNGDETQFMRFKPVRGAFTLSQTTGEELPEITVPDWDADRAMEKLNITRQPWNDVEGNAQGVSHDRIIRINPVAKWAGKTILHEMAHIEHGHTAADQHGEYLKHRGRFEYEAEAAALLVSKEIGLSTPEQDSESRGYLQHWLKGETPPDQSIRRVFKVSDTIIRAGQPELALIPEA